MKTASRGLWISVDGVDGVGKSTLANHLVSQFSASVLAPEFSDSPIGSYLRQAVQSNPHYISPSLIEQSLLFLAEFFRIYEVFVRPALREGLLVISDRGYASKYVYQFLILSSKHDPATTEEMLDSLFRLISPPDYTLLLTCDEDVLIKRLLKRDGHCDDNRIRFMRQANQRYQGFLAARHMNFQRIHQTSQTQLESLLHEGVEAVKQLL